PISDIIRKDPRRKEMIVSAARVPSLDDPDEEVDHTPLPPPQRESHLDMTHTDNPSNVGKRPRGLSQPRGQSTDEAAAMDAIGDLDQSARKVHTAGDQAAAAVAKLEDAAHRADRAARRLETNTPMRAMPALIPTDLDAPPPRLKSPLRAVFGAVIVLGILGGAGYFVY